MKKRQGFISNSSSSSFILALDKKPESVEEIKEILFGTEEFYKDPYYDPDCTYFAKRTPGYPTSQVAETVFDDLKNQKPMTKEQVSEEMGSGWIDGAPGYESFEDSSNEHNIDWDAYQKASKEFQDKCADELINEAKGKVLFVVEYSDDCSYGCALEHGPLFDNIDAYRISKH